MYKQDNNKINKNENWFIKYQKYFSKKLQINNLTFTLIVFLILLIINLSKENKRKLNINNKITLIVEGNGKYRSILGGNTRIPNQVIINGDEQETLAISYKLTEQENTVIVSWNSSLTSCLNMFYNLNYILFIDFSEFDSSQVSDMIGMFFGCSNLKSINFKNFDTSLVTSMESMFCRCNSLISLNLSNFRTPLVTSMRKMFSNCTSLVSIDISNFNTSLVTTMESMFSNDVSLNF